MNKEKLLETKGNSNNNEFSYLLKYSIHLINK